MNRGPEIFEPEGLLVEYSREERLKAFPLTRGRKRAFRKYSMKLLMLDILFLCIIGGVVYPFIVKRNSRGSLDGMPCSLSLRYAGEYVYITVEMKNEQKKSEPCPVELRIFGDGQLVKRGSDLTPPAGGVRSFYAKMKRGKEQMLVLAELETEKGLLVLKAVAGASS